MIGFHDSQFHPHNYSVGEVDAVLSAPQNHIIISTSGSTGTPKHVVLGSAALAFSGRAADAALSGPGQWLLTLPTDHIAGVNVLARSVLAGTEPVILDRSQSFTQQQFVAATQRLSHSTTYVSLVPTQLHRLLEKTPIFDESLAALQSYAGILVGGAAVSPLLLDTTKSLGINAVTTYGMSETSGGCVYNGHALEGVHVSVDSDSRIWLSGPMLAQGYAQDIRHPHDVSCQIEHALIQSPAFAVDHEGVRWHRTNDLGAVSQEGVLTVLGRADDIILSGGINVSPQAIEHALNGNFGIAQSLVVGVPDPEWGSKIVALVTQGTAQKLPLTEIKTQLASNLEKGHVPRAFLTVDQLPLTHTGKPDRRKAQKLAMELLA